MKKLLAALLVGAVLGSIATYTLKPDTARPAFPKPPERDLREVPEISIAEAEVHRRDRYESIKTIEDTLALPTDFAETEALYVIAGRSDSSGVQDLIYQAARIAERNDRQAALRILLSRLTELDPYSALAIARDPTLGNSSSFENTVWTTWARLDLDAALMAAQDGTFSQKSTAAQALYASVRNADAEKIDLIQSTLNVPPGRNARAQQIYAMADRSVAEAIRFIETEGSAMQQQEHFGWLAHYLSRSGDASGSNYASMIQSPTHRAIFEQAMATYSMQENPERALEQYVSNPHNPTHQAQAYSAFQSVAQQDPDKALAYLERIGDRSIRQNMMSVVISSIAMSDPQRALEWARANDKSVDQSTVSGVIAQIAQRDPQLALTEAQSLGNSQLRDQSIAMVMMVTAQNDPARAAEMLSMIGNSAHRRSTLGTLGSQWAARDFDAAVQWVSSLNTDEQRMALQGMGQQLAHADVDRAITLLQRFPASGPRNLKLQIARNLAQQRSIDAAQSFVDRYKGTDDYPRLQASIIGSVANTDPARAMQMADSIADERQRDQLYSQIVSRKAGDDPRLALQWMESISDSAQRQQTMSQVVRVWNANSPDEARAWVNSLPRGDARDDAIVAIAIVNAQNGRDARQLINTIDSETKRKQASLGLLQQLMYIDSGEAERLLNELSLSDDERRQYQQMLDNVQYSGYSIDF